MGIRNVAQYEMAKYTCPVCKGDVGFDVPSILEITDKGNCVFRNALCESSITPPVTSTPVRNPRKAAHNISGVSIMERTSAPEYMSDVDFGDMCEDNTTLTYNPDEQQTTDPYDYTSFLASSPAVKYTHYDSDRSGSELEEEGVRVWEFPTSFTPSKIKREGDEPSADDQCDDDGELSLDEEVDEDDDRSDSPSSCEEDVGDERVKLQADESECTSIHESNKVLEEIAICIPDMTTIEYSFLPPARNRNAKLKGTFQLLRNGRTHKHVYWFRTLQFFPDPVT